MLILVMGVRGAGKTPLAQELASVMGYKFVDSTEFYSDSIVKKLNNNDLLDEHERKEFFANVKLACSKSVLGAENIVLSCPALRENDRREILGEAGSFRIVYLEGESDHQKQMEILEPPKEAIRVKSTLPIQTQVDIILQNLSMQFAA